MKRKTTLPKIKIDDFSHHTTYKDFESDAHLDKNQTKVVLRLLKVAFERHMGFDVADDFFIDLIHLYPYLAPLHPLCAPQARLGYVRPLQKLLNHYSKKYEINDIMSFFRIPSGNWNKYQNLLLHIPHSSTVFPEGSEHSFGELLDDEKQLIDYYTDELFATKQKSDRIQTAVFPYCRLFCDVERLINDPLEKKGLGITYHRRTKFGSCSFDYTGNPRIQYMNFHLEVAKTLVRMERTLLIDCHSFSAFPNLLNANPPDIDICIGFNNDETCPPKMVIGNIVEYFKENGFKVGINNPFSNSKTFPVPKKYHSIMIEVNKRLYMDEHTLKKSEGFEKVRDVIQNLYPMLLER